LLKIIIGFGSSFLLVHGVIVGSIEGIRLLILFVVVGAKL
jgi:hypothetical protein